ncbi:unnamed protein product, partial [Mesorhabditis belari]|uniref:Uncharacterized protein n=1 Tax=Mesorhabditis belari TaxID=2138241 RepID=A0AAF3EZ30_9BILA
MISRKVFPIVFSAILLLQLVEGNLSIGRLGPMLGPKRSERSLSRAQLEYLDGSDVSKRASAPLSIEFPSCMREAHDKIMALKSKAQELELMIEREMENLRQCALHNL